MKKDNRTTWRTRADVARATKANVKQEAKAMRHRKKLLARMAWEKAEIKRIIAERGLEEEAKEAGHEA